MPRVSVADIEAAVHEQEEHDEEHQVRMRSAQHVDAPVPHAAECKCSPCNPWRACASPMFLVVWGIVYCNYMPYVVWMPHTTLWDWLCVLVFHVFVGLLLGSYMQCVFTDPGTIPPEWNRAIASDTLLSAQHRVCPRTKQHRPLRSHYCSITGRVVLNMDHFCPWVCTSISHLT